MTSPSRIATPALLHPAHGLGMTAESVFEGVAGGDMPGPGQFRSGVRLLLGAGLIVQTGTRVLDTGAGPDVTVAVFELTAEGRQRWVGWVEAHPA